MQHACLYVVYVHGCGEPLFSIAPSSSPLHFLGDKRFGLLMTRLPFVEKYNVEPAHTKTSTIVEGTMCKGQRRRINRGGASLRLCVRPFILKIDPNESRVSVRKKSADCLLLKQENKNDFFM